MKILISGGSGLLASHLLACNKNHELTPLAHHQMDVRRYNEVLRAVVCHKPDVFLHCAAMTVPMSDHDRWQTASISTNITGTAIPVSVCYSTGVRLVYISTDFVYPGTDGYYREESPLRPINNYARSKLGGEMAAQMLSNSLILRCSFTERPFRHPRAFVDCYKSYIYVDEIAPLILRVIESGYTGVVNVGGQRRTVYDFARESVPDVGKITRAEVADWVPADVSMDITLLGRILRHDPTLQYPAERGNHL